MSQDPSITSASRSYDDLFAGDLDRVEETVVLASGQNTVRGAVLGVITASGKWALSLSGAGDGSEVPRAILAKDTDASAADTNAAIYRTGEFNEAALTLGAAHTIATIREGLAEKGIYLKTTVAS